MDLFNVFLLASGKVEHFVGTFDEDGTLGLGLGNVERGSEDSDFGSGNFFDDALRFATEYHALYDTAAGEVTSHDFNDAYVVHIEVFWFFWHDGQCSFCDECRQGILESILF
jgi:hypothetical protein